MKKKQQDEEEEEEDEDGKDLEIIKAVAQAWHGHSESSRTTSEFNAHRHSFKTGPTRFKLEAAATKVSVSSSSSSLTTSDKNGFTSWDFGQSLLDSYEIVAVSKKLETGLVLDNTVSFLDDPKGSSKRRKESKNSLRNLFGRLSSSKRFSDTNIPLEGGN